MDNVDKIYHTNGKVVANRPKTAKNAASLPPIAVGMLWIEPVGCLYEALLKQSAELFFLRAA